MKKSDLLKYLNDCKEQELTCYRLDREEQELQQYVKTLGIPRQISPPDMGTIRIDFPNTGLNRGEIASRIVCIIYVVVAVIWALSSASTAWGFSLFNFIFTLVISGVAGFMIFPFLFAFLNNDDEVSPEAHRQYQLAIINYHNELDQDKKRVEYEKEQIELIWPRIYEVEKQKKQAEQTLDKLYEVGIVYQKYRALIPIVMFIEYIESGICSGLESHEGAYSRYEDEVFRRIIICKFDEILDKLDEIEENQYMLYSALKEGNRKVDRLCGAVYDSASRLENIENNTAISAENSKISAENTRILEEIETYKLLLK